MIWYVPFAALIESRMDGALPAHDLIENYELRSVPSPAFLTDETRDALPRGVRVQALAYEVPGAENDDGLLHGAEVARQRLMAKLVVLTDCEVGGGALFAGEGLIGIARAFLLGGARFVIASQWPVGASAVTLTENFYRALATGQRPSAALRSAQLAMLGSPQYAHPIHWAAFVAFDAGNGAVRLVAHAAPPTPR